MAARFVSIALLAVAAVHLLPAVGALGAARLEALYGTAVRDPDLLVLMRHRAVLFAVLGALLALAAFRPALQPVALGAGLASVASFLALHAATPGTNAALGRVAAVDAAAAVLLVAAAAARATLPPS